MAPYRLITIFIFRICIIYLWATLTLFTLKHFVQWTDAAIELAYRLIEMIRMFDKCAQVTRIL